MGITYRVLETCRNGSFKMWGVGFIYNYNAHTRIIDIIHARGKHLLMSITLDEDDARHARAYVQCIEKSCQIKAMLLSNNETINLVATLENERLYQILSSVTYLSELAFDLQTKKLNTFCSHIEANYNLESLFIKRMACHRSKSIYYKARLETIRGNEAIARAPTLPATLRLLSEYIIQDILPHEFTTEENYTSALLTISSKLSLISRILDQQYIPNRYARTAKNMSESDDKVTA